MAKAPPWTPAQDALLRKHHGVLSGDEIAKLVGRTVKACGAQSSRLGIRSLRTGWSSKEVAPELGVSISTVVRWIEKRLLEASRRTTYEESQNPQWYVIQEEAIIQFLQTHYLRYDPSQLKERWKEYVPQEERAKWISIAEASIEYDRSYQWFYELVWNGEISAKKGWEETGQTTFLYRKDIESVKERIHGTEGGIRPFAERPSTRSRGEYKKGARRGPWIEQRVVSSSRVQRWAVSSSGFVFTLERMGLWVRIHGDNSHTLSRAQLILSSRYQVRAEIVGQTILVKTSNEAELQRFLMQLGSVTIEPTP